MIREWGFFYFVFNCRIKILRAENAPEMPLINTPKQIKNPNGIMYENLIKNSAKITCKTFEINNPNALDLFCFLLYCDQS